MVMVEFLWEGKDLVEHPDPDVNTTSAPCFISIC